MAQYSMRFLGVINVTERTVVLDGFTLNTLDVHDVAHGHANVQIAREAMMKVQTARAVVDRIVSGNEIVYGINTGFGSLVHSRIDQDDVEQLQLNLIRSHATGLGPNLPTELVRAMMCVRLNSLVKGHSGCHPDVVLQLSSFINKGIHPIVPRIGSLGASGDLAPLSHLACALVGEGKVEFEGRIMNAMEAIQHCDLVPLTLKAKDGLSLINGTSLITGMLSLSIEQLRQLLTYADIIAGMSIDATESTLTPFDERIHKTRPHQGQLFVSSRMQQILSDSEILRSHNDCNRVQDPYSFRCIPQVHGPVQETLQKLIETVSIELNSSTDNPLIFPDSEHPGPHEVVSQGNFHAEVLALVSDAMSLGLFELSSISERRIDQMLDPNRRAITPFLAENPGLESGLMIVQYAAAAALGELHGHSAPRTAFTTTTSAGQEDHVSMGATASWNLYEAIQRCSEVVACEAFVAHRAIKMIGRNSSTCVEALLRCMDHIIPEGNDDRSTSEEIIQIANEFRSSKWLSIVQSVLNSPLRKSI